MRFFLKISTVARLDECMMVAIGVAIGGHMMASTPQTGTIALAAIAGLLTCAGWNMVDKLAGINYSTVLFADVRHSWRLAVGLIVVSWILSCAVSWIALATVIGAGGMLLLYKLKLRHIPILGQTISSLLAGSVFLAGGLAVDPSAILSIPGPIIPAVLAFVGQWLYLLVKDTEKLHDREVARDRTIPQIIGVDRTLTLTLILLTILVLLTMIPVLAGWFGSGYKVVAVYVVDLPLLAMLILVWGSPHKKMLRTATLGLRAGMWLGLLALALR